MSPLRRLHLLLGLLLFLRCCHASTSVAFKRNFSLKPLQSVQLPGAHNLLRCKASSIALRGCDHAAGKCCEKCARMYAPLALTSPLGAVLRPFSLLLKPNGTIYFLYPGTRWLLSSLQYSMTHRLRHMIYCVYSGSQVRILPY